jgi:hypothetical protein
VYLIKTPVLSLLFHTHFVFIDIIEVVLGLLTRLEVSYKALIIDVLLVTDLH